MEGLLLMMVLALAGALAWLAARDRLRTRDLTHLAELLDAHGSAPAARARLESTDPAVRKLAAAMDRAFDAEQDRELARRAADERFREQLSALSHDLRTPLAGAQGYLQLARRTPDAAQAAHFLGGAEERLAALRVLVDDVFAWARAADPTWEPTLAPCDLRVVVAEALAARYAELAERAWEPEVVLVDDGPLALADAEALARVVANLLDNALAHGSGAPSLHATGRALVIENPVDPELAARIDPARLTERFYQGDPSRAGRGTGLGLAVASALAEAMGGELSVSVTAGPSPYFSARLALRAADPRQE